MKKNNKRKTVNMKNLSQKVKIIKLEYDTKQETQVNNHPEPAKPMYVNNLEFLLNKKCENDNGTI